MNRNRTNYILNSVIATFLLLLTIGTMMKPDKKLSENENRYLQQKPTIGFSQIISGDFEKKEEAYLNDQILGREKWIRIMATSLRAAGYRDINGTYVCNDGRLIERLAPKDFNCIRFRDNIDEVSIFTDGLTKEAIPVYTILVPSAANVYSEKYSIGGMYDENNAMKYAKDTLGKSLVNIENAFRIASRKNASLYYMTDHHWNNIGVKTAYREYIKTVSGGQLCKCNSERLTDDFKGTLYSKVLLNSTVKDCIDTPECVDGHKLSVRIGDREYKSILFKDRLKKKDKYEVFLGGNYDRVDITVKENTGKPSILIIKDSYANSFVPYMLNDFGKIVMIDPRYYKGSIKELAKSERFDSVLILFSIINFSKENIKLNKEVLF